jgi:hypothetical protein
MIKNKKINKSNSGFYNIRLKEGLNTKDWIYHWFIIKNLFMEKGYIIQENRDESGGYIEVVGYHNANILEDKFWRKEPSAKGNIYSFKGDWKYKKDIENNNLEEELENLFKKYFELNNIEIVDIEINNWESDKYHYLIKIERNLKYNEWLSYYVELQKILLLNNIKIEDYHDNDLDIEIVKGLAKEGTLNFYEGYFIHKIDDLTFKKFKSIVTSFFKNKEKLIIISS